MQVFEIQDQAIQNKSIKWFYVNSGPDLLIRLIVFICFKKKKLLALSISPIVACSARRALTRHLKLSIFSVVDVDS